VINRLYNKINYEFWGAGDGRVKLLGPKCQKAHPTAIYGRLNRLLYVPLAMFGCYARTTEKSVRIPIRNLFITLQWYRNAVKHSYNYLSESVSTNSIRPIRTYVYANNISS